MSDAAACGAAFARLVEIVDALLGPDGCPWDREQTHESLKKHLLEEVYEFFEAIDSGDPGRMVEELGDLLLQPAMHGRMLDRDSARGLAEATDGIVEKLIRRHPHVFGEDRAADAEEVLRNWDRIKQSERPTDDSKSILSGVPRSLPSLLRAHEISKRAARVGFEWPDRDAVFAKLHEEVEELRAAIADGRPEEIEAEVGDLLFTAVNLARWCSVEPEDALRKMLHRFTDRFMAMESAAGKPLRDLSPSEWERLWTEAKSAETR